MMNKSKELLLYIHIPFCKRKCSYCDFLSGPGDREEIAEYVNSLLLEIRAYKEEAVKLKDYTVTSIFIGGGTPSYIDSDYILRIMEEIERVFSFASKEKLEVTLEANPGTLNRKALRIYKKAGISRLSLGLQSIKEEELRLLGRIHTYSEFLESYDCAREEGFQNINIDLMSGLPGQTEASWEETLKTVTALSPEHISAYSLIVEEDTPFYELCKKGALNLPKEDAERNMYYAAKEILSKAGYQRYEISNYAKPGFECRHNTGYWVRTDYLGMGLGAASLFENTRFTNTKDMPAYEKAKGNLKQIHKDKTYLSRKERIEEFMFLGLRRMEGIKSQSFKEYFGLYPQEVYPHVLDKLTKEKLICRTAEGIGLTDYGIDISNYVLSQFLLSDTDEFI